MKGEVPDNVCGTLSGVTQRLGSPSWTQWNVRLVTELDWRQFWFGPRDFGQLDSVKLGQQDSANYVQPGLGQIKVD